MFRTALRTALRPASNAVRSSQITLTAARVPVHRCLSSTRPLRDATPLSTKLAEEIKYEEESAAASPGEPEFLQDFRNEGVWQIQEQPGADEVILTRTYGNENIRIIFSISDLDAEPEVYDEENDVAPHESDPADSAKDGTSSDAAGSSSASSATNFPVDVSITITKHDNSAPGALAIDAVCQDGMFVISNVAHYADAQTATGLSSEDDWKRQGLYMGPAFTNLDEGVQAEFDAFLDERGIDSALALFIPDLAEWKEQQEYLAWLRNVRAFVEA